MRSAWTPARVRRFVVRGLIVVLFFWTPVESVNPASRLAVTESLLSRGTAATEGSPFFNPVDTAYVDGHFYSNNLPLLSLYSAAVLWPVYRFTTFEGPAWRLLYWLVVATSSGAALLAIFFLLRGIRRWTKSAKPSLRWALGAVVGGTCLLPFARTYNDHIVEAAIFLGVLALLLRYRDTGASWVPLAVGGLVGTVGILHPLPGIVFAGTTAFYFLIAARTAGDGRRTRGSLGAIGSFTASLLAVVLVGAGIQVLLYGSPIPYYFRPEFQMWAGVPGMPDSAWLDDPLPPGLTAEGITARFAELGLPDTRLQQTLAALADYRESVRNPLTYAAGRFFVYDQLTFNPLVLFCGFLIVRSLWSADFRYRREWLWILLGVAGLYAATVFLRAVPGGSFGDRYLLPVLPVVVCAGILGLRDRAETRVFQALTLLSLTMMAPGAIGPWTTPGTPFLAFNLAVNAVALAFIVWFFRSPSAGPAVERLEGRLGAEGRLALTIGFVGWTLTEFALYLPSLDFVLR